MDLPPNYGHGSKAASRPLRTLEVHSFSCIVKMSKRIESEGVWVCRSGVVIVLAERNIVERWKLLVKLIPYDMGEINLLMVVRVVLRGFDDLGKSTGRNLK